MTPDRTTQNKLSGVAQQPVRAPRGANISCQGWPQEAALRLLMNSLDPELTDLSSEYAIRGGEQQGALAWESFNNVVTALRKLASDETLSVQSGAPAGVFRTSPKAPRLVLVSTPTASMESPFDDLHVFSNSSAASWFYMGPQGVLQAIYEIMKAVSRKHFGGTLTGKLVLANGLDMVGGAQSLAATLQGAAFLGIDVNSEQIKRCVKSGYCEVMVNDLDEALRILKNAVRRREASSVGLVGNGASVISELARRGVLPDLVLSNSHAEQTRGVSELQRLGAVLLGGENSKEFGPRALFGEDHEPLSWIALSGNPADIARVDRLLLELFPSNEHVQHWVPLLQKHVRTQGLPGRVVWLSRAERLQFAGAINGLVTRGEVSAPFVFGRVWGRRFENIRTKANPAASETAQSMAQHLLTDVLPDVAAGASWAAFELSGDGASIVLLISCAIVADGAVDTAARIERVLGDALTDGASAELR